MSDDFPPGWPTAEQRERVDARSRVLRNRRRATGAGALAVVVALVAGGVIVANRGSNGSDVHVAAGPTTTATAPPTGPAIVSAPEPEGWRIVDFGDARIAVPPGWIDAEPHDPPVCSGLPAKGFRFFLPEGNCPSITIGPIGTPTLPPRPAMTVHGIAVYEAAGTIVSVTYAVPELGVAITTHDAEARALLSTLTSSARRVVTGPGPAPSVPASWKTVSYGGYTLRVPATLAVTTLDDHMIGPGVCSDVPFPQAGVFLGDGEQGIIHCPMIGFAVPEPTDAVWMHSDAGTHVTELQGTRIGDVTVGFRDSDPREPVLELGLSRDGDNPNPGTGITLGLGADPTIARTILYSIRPAS